MTALDEAAGMTFRMPALGQGVTECAVTRWLKGPGERIEEDEPLLEVATDKVDTEIPSPCAGVIARMMADENDVV
jgi:2-oxoglutarate dehydrogenase E2 component (dihydrolipoamide succinyltransferase)